MGGERAGEWARDCHFSFSGLTDPNNRVSTGGESEGREDSEDKNQSLNPPNQQLSGDSTDTLDPSSRLPSFVLMKAMPSLSRQKVLTTNPDDFSPPPHLPLHPFISFHPSLCEKVPAASLKRQMWEHRFLPKAPTALTVLQYFLFIWLHSMWTAYGCMLQILSYFVHVTWYSWMLLVFVFFLMHECLLSVPLTRQGWRWLRHRTTGCTNRTSPQSTRALWTLTWETHTRTHITRAN